MRQHMRMAECGMTETSPGVFAEELGPVPRPHDAPPARSRRRRWMESAGVATALIAADLLAAIIAISLSFVLAAIANELVGRPYGSLPWFIEMREPILSSMLVLMSMT